MNSDQLMDWHRVAGSFANVAPSRGGACSPTIGTAAHTCSCCGERYVVIAAVAPDGSEINVALPIAEAVDVAQSIFGWIERMTGETAGGAIN